jgi:hypothetical protein
MKSLKFELRDGEDDDEREQLKARLIGENEDDERIASDDDEEIASDGAFEEREGDDNEFVSRKLHKDYAKSSHGPVVGINPTSTGSFEISVPRRLCVFFPKNGLP